ncbi:MAG: DEAD/DEAH box helicase [Dongiaceae bacterium]
MTDFTNLGLAAPILKALASEGYATPTPIQAQAIPQILQGRDLVGIAQTGTGKTAAFALPILHRLAADRRKVEPRSCRTLVLSPTRELASQIADSFRTYGRHIGLSVAVAFGGVSIAGQIRALAPGVDVLVATPGRLLDLVSQHKVRLDRLEIFVLDEADRMLDMGFIRDIRRLVRALPPVRQNLFFSATMPQEIGQLASELLRDPVKVAVAPVATTAERVEQRVIFVDTAQKRSLLVTLLRDDSFGRTLVFTRTKHGADRVVRHLTGAGIGAEAIHGNKSQGQRERALSNFRSGHARVLVATDIASRGIDVDAVTHVVNFDIPADPESYVHRIGRTARAGAAGIAISLCGGEERANLRDIEKLIRQPIPAMRHGAADHAAGPETEAPARRELQAASPPPQRHGRGHGGPHRQAGHSKGGHRDKPARENGHRPAEGHRADHDGNRRNGKARGEHRPANGAANSHGNGQPRRDHAPEKHRRDGEAAHGHRHGKGRPREEARREQPVAPREAGRPHREPEPRALASVAFMQAKPQGGDRPLTRSRPRPIAGR